MNLITPPELDIRVSCGIDFGRFLLVKEGEFFGDVVNKASKLGEDISGPGEILVTEEALMQVADSSGIRSKVIHLTISGIELNVRQILY